MLSKKDIKFIRDLASAKERSTAQVFVAEGQKTVSEFISEGWLVQAMYSLEEMEIQGQKAERISPKELGRISHLKNPKDVLALLRIPSRKLPDKFEETTLVCESVRDPGNMGTIVRIADWFGISSVVCSKDCADVFNPKVVQSTMGSLARVEVYYSDLTQVIEKNTHLPLLVTHLEGASIYDAELPEESFIVLGNESRGVSDELLKRASIKVKIPGRGKAESLNVAVSAGIVCSEIFRRSAFKGK